MAWQAVALIGVGAAVLFCAGVLALMARWSLQHARQLDRMQEETERRVAERREHIRRAGRPAGSRFALHRSDPR